MRRRATSFALLSILWIGAQCNAADWRQFRGANASGLSNEADLPETWSDEQNIRWKASIPGEGWSAPVVTDGKVIVSTAVSHGEASRESEHSWEVHCLDQATGEVLWKQVAIQGKPRLGKHRANTYASETPVTDGQYVVVYFGMMGVVCYDLDGQLMWRKDLGSYEMRNSWGTASSPAMHDGKVFIQVDSEQDSFLVALDVASGEEVWRKDRQEGSNWGSAMIWQNRLRTELVTNGQTVRSYDPDDGDLLWELDLGDGGVNSTASGTDSVLIVGRAGRDGSALHAVEAGASGDLSSGSGILWSNTTTGPEMSSPLVYEGYVYLLRRNGGQVTCLDASNGDQVFRGRLPDAGEFWASPWAHGGNVYCPDANGSTFVLRPGPEMQVVSVNHLTKSEGTRYWASSAISDGRIFIRSSDTLFAIGVK